MPSVGPEQDATSRVPRQGLGVHPNQSGLLKVARADSGSPGVVKTSKAGRLVLMLEGEDPRETSSLDRFCRRLNLPTDVVVSGNLTACSVLMRQW